MGNEASFTWSSTYNEIKSKHDEAYKAIQTAITLEEQEKPFEALEMYKKGISFIDSALRVQVTCPSNPEQTWEKAVEMIQKMKRTRGEVLSRITSIQKSHEIFDTPEPPPSYDEAMSSTPTSDVPHTYSDLANALNQMTINTDTEMEAEVIYMYENVKLYFVSPTGEVSSTMIPQTLKIILVQDEGRDIPRAILQIGDWVYPLIPGVSPCYRSDYSAFILPNIYSETPGASIGIILPPDADAEAYDLLESILYGIVGEAKPQKELSEKISTGLVTGATYISKGLTLGAQKLETLINRNTPKLINSMNGADTPTEIPGKVTKSMQIAENATNKAARVTGFVAAQVGVATMKLGHFLAPHIEKQGTRLLTNFNMTEDEAALKMKGVLTVAAGAVEGFSTIYCGLEQSAGILGKSLKENTVKVVQHRYGHPAGELAGDTLDTMGNVYYITRNARVIQPKYLAKSTVKEAGKAMVKQHQVNDGAGTSRHTFSNDKN